MIEYVKCYYPKTVKIKLDKLREKYSKFANRPVTEDEMFDYYLQTQLD